MKTAVVFGASGQIGAPLLSLLRDDGWRVIAVSRRARSDTFGLEWRQGDFAQLPPLPVQADALISCGPLDLFAHWLAEGGVAAERIVAFGSTSVKVKHDSSDPDERLVAGKLQRGEDTVFNMASQRGMHATVLRPTLIYGVGRDANLTQIAQLAQKHRRFLLPRKANGLRQPVHVDDLAKAAFLALSAPPTYGVAYDVPGGETLPYREMVKRVLACLQPPVPLYEVPGPVFALALRVAQRAGIARSLGAAAVQRMRSNLAFDAEPARRDFGYAPRPFRPTAAMFEPPPS